MGKRKELQQNKERGETIGERSEKFSKINEGMMYEKRTTPIGYDITNHYLFSKKKELEAKHINVGVKNGENNNN